MTDGINGQYTSQFKWTTMANTGQPALQQGRSSILSKHGLTVQKILEWNNFVDWMKQKGYSGTAKMDDLNYQYNVYQEYTKEHPSFWVTYQPSKTSNDIRSIQAAIKDLRILNIELYQKNELKLDTKLFKDRTPEENTDVIDRYMPWAK